MIRAAALALAILGTVVPVGLPDVPWQDGHGEPSDQQLRTAVTATTDQGIETSVDRYVIDDKTVRSLVETTQKSGTTTITLVNDILFAFDSADISPAADARVAEAVGAIPKATAVSVSGYTDSVGDTAANLTLSQQRAEAVAAIVRAQRPDLTLTVTGYGEANPVAPNESDGQDDPAGRALNRRVELSYTS